METKICVKCGIKKNINDFYYLKQRNKYQNKCKECVKKQKKEYFKKYRQNNIEYLKKKDKNFRKLNKDYMKES